MAVERRDEQVVGDEACLEKALELRVGTREVVEGLGEDGVALLAAQEEELTTQEEPGGRLARRVVEQLACRAQMLGGRLAVDQRLGGADSSSSSARWPASGGSARARRR